MDKERILELARQERVLIPGLIGFQDSLVEFARELLRIARADEREACARLENEIKQMEVIPEQEPVAKVAVRPFNPMDASYPTVEVKWLKEPISGFLYAAPVRTKDLTDDEINELWLTHGQGRMMYIHEKFARAVIAKDREKNK